MADTHKHVGNHAREICGVMYAPGESFTLTDEQTQDRHVKDMMDSRVIISLAKTKKGDEVDDSSSGN